MLLGRNNSLRRCLNLKADYEPFARFLQTSAEWRLVFMQEHIPLVRRNRPLQPTASLEEWLYRTKRQQEADAHERKQANVKREAAIQEEMRKQEIVLEAARRLPATQAVTDDLAAKRRSHPKATVEFSTDYRTISFNGQPRYRLTSQQAAIVKVLHQSPHHEASTQTIKKHTQCGSIRDSFRSGDGPKMWKRFIVPLDHPKGFYRLNLRPTKSPASVIRP